MAGEPRRRDPQLKKSTRHWFDATDRAEEIMNQSIKAFFVAASLMVVPLLPAGAQEPGQNPPQGTPTTTAPTTPPQDAAKAQAQGQAQGQTPAPAPGTPEKKVITPEQAGLSFTPPQGWKEGDPKG